MNDLDQKLKELETRLEKRLADYKADIDLWLHKWHERWGMVIYDHEIKQKPTPSPARRRL